MQTAAAAAAQLWSEAFEPNVVQAQVVKAPAFGDGTPTLDVTALRSDDGQRLSLIVTNAAEVPVTLQITLANFPAEPSAGILTVTGDSVSANNSWKAPDTIGLARGSQDVNQPSFSFNVPAHSIRALQLKRSSS